VGLREICTMQINNICITGQFQNEQTFEWGKKNIKLYDNNIVLKRNCFSITLTKNIRQVLQIKNLKKFVRDRIRYETGIRIRKIRWKIGNIHESLTVRCAPDKVTKELLPAISERFGIEKTFVTQEQNRPLLTDIRQVISGQFPFIAIKIRTLKNKCTLKIQLGKDRQHVQITTILSAFTKKTAPKTKLRPRASERKLSR